MPGPLHFDEPLIMVYDSSVFFASDNHITYRIMEYHSAMDSLMVFANTGLGSFKGEDIIFSIPGYIGYLKSTGQYGREYWMAPREVSTSISADQIPSPRLIQSLYPNPTQGTFYLQLDPSPKTQVRIQVYSADGIPILYLLTEPGTPGLPVDLSHCAPGIYFIEASSQNERDFTSIVRY